MTRSIHLMSGKRLTGIGAAVSALALLAGCAGGAGGEGPGQATGGDSGFDYGASQEDVDAAIADLDPITLTLQSGSPSEISTTGEQAVEFKEEVEERSGGKITIDIAWGMSIAGYPEVVDALQDGRVDISYHLLGYEPQRFPEATDIGTALASVKYSPQVGEMTAYAVGSAIGWSNEGHLQRFEDEGVTPLAPFITSGAYSLNCNSEIATAEEFKNKQVRIGAASQQSAATHFGAVPTSMEFTEAFEAMQRGTIDCDLSPMAAKDISGVYEAAPHLTYSTQANWPRFPATYMAGSTFTDLPLAYQQIIADSSAMSLASDVQGYINSNAQHIDDLHSVDGTINEFDDAWQEQLAEYIPTLQQEAIDNGTIDDATLTQIADLEEEWTTKIGELGYEDGGDMETINEWVDREADFDEYAWSVYEETGALDNRPGS